MENIDNTRTNRRDFLKTTGTILTAGLAGCAGNKTPHHTETTRSTSQPETATDTATQTKLLEQTHQTENLDKIKQKLEQDTVTLSFLPADEDADYSNSNIFDQYSSEGENTLNVELDLSQAIKQRHHNQDARNHPAVEEFIQNIDNKKWRAQILEEADSSGSLDWGMYTDESLTYGERYRESGMSPFWYTFENLRFGGISSANNQFKAQALQGAEKEAGFNTFVWDYGIPGHGLVSAIENPTRSKEQTENQETYIVETDFTDGQQVSTWENSQYQQKELHPVREEVNRREKDFYSRTAIGGSEANLYESVTRSQKGTERFIDFFRNPESGPAYDHLDPMAAAAYIAEENIVNGDLDGSVMLGTDTISTQR